mgnify:CR=1 FL=1
MLELKQTQKLSPVLTQQLQQAIKLLQLSKLELSEAIDQEMKENPILEVREETPEEPAQESQQEKEKNEDIADWLDRFSPSEEYVPRDNRELPDFENTIRKTYNLRDHLRWQIGLSQFDPQERLVAEWIVENVDDNGYLVCPLEEISNDSGFSVDSLQDVLKKVQKLEPSGVAARDLKECILLQYEASGEKDEIFENMDNSSQLLYKLQNTNAPTAPSPPTANAAFQILSCMP